jgi:hypothetical protein
MSRPQNDVAEARIIDSIRISLALQADAGVGSIRDAGLSSKGSVEIDTGIKLQMRFGGEYFEHSPTVRMDQTGGRRGFGIGDALSAIANPIEVTMISKQLRYRLPNVPKLAEVVVSANHRCNLSKKSHSFIGQYERIGVDLELVIGDGTGRFARKVEVGVLSRTERRRPVGRSLDFNQESIVVSDGISDSHIHFSWVSLFAVRASVSKTKRGGPVCIFSRDSGPDFLIESLDTAVKVVRPIVPGQFVSISFEIEMRAGDASCDPSYEGAEIEAAGKVRFEIVETKNYIGQASISVGRQ